MSNVTLLIFMVHMSNVNLLDNNYLILFTSLQTQHTNNSFQSTKYRIHNTEQIIELRMTLGHEKINHVNGTDRINW